jgi:tocopherol O-methyltransferase
MCAENWAKGATAQFRWLVPVIEYYNQTQFDYRAVWLDSENLAFHFGYYGERIDDHAQALANTNRVLSEVARIRPGERVLDAGCGLGGSCLWLAEHRSADVVGITPVMHQVTKARTIAASRSLGDRVRFERADYSRTAFPDGSFDVVWALESLCHAVEKAAFYRESARLLRPGGRLVVAEYIRTSRDVNAQGEALMRQWLDGWAIPDLDTPDEHIGAADRAGFAEVRLIDNTAKADRSLRRLYKLARIAWAVDWTLYAFGFRSKTQHGNVVAALRQYQALRQGLWFYGILSATKPW